MIIRVVDFESTGEGGEAKVCEIGFCDLVPTRTNLAGEPAGWQIGRRFSTLCDPGQPITAETSAVHHIIDEDVKGQLPAGSYVSLLTSQKEPGPRQLVFAAHSAKFEQQFLGAHAPAVEWICTYKCGLWTWPLAPAHSNQGLRYWLRPPGLDRLAATPAHRALPDAYVTAHLVMMLLELNSLPQLLKWSTQPALQAICRIGDWRGKRWSEVDDGFLHWILGKDFDEDVVFTVRHELARRQRERATQNSGDNPSNSA